MLYVRINICYVFQPKNGENAFHVVTVKIYDFLEISFIGAKIILFHFVKNCNVLYLYTATIFSLL